MKLDRFNIAILEALQADADQPQRALADKVGLSQNACWRRLKQLEADGVIKGRRLVLNRDALDQTLVAFVLLKTRRHSSDWLRAFRRHVSGIPEVIDFFRIGGEYDYLLKVVTRSMRSYDSVYQRLNEGQDLDAVTSYFAMEAIEEQRPIPLG